MKRRILDDDDATNTARVSVGAPTGIPLAAGIEKYTLPSGLFLYRYHLGSYPPNVQEHDELNGFLGKLIPKLILSSAFPSFPEFIRSVFFLSRITSTAAKHGMR